MNARRASIVCVTCSIAIYVVLYFGIRVSRCRELTTSPGGTVDSVATVVIADASWVQIASRMAYPLAWIDNKATGRGYIVCDSVGNVSCAIRPVASPVP